MKVKLSLKLLRELHNNGYEVLESDRELPDNSAVFTPRKVHDLVDYLNNLEEHKMMELIIREALSWSESEMMGFVELPDDLSFEEKQDSRANTR